MMPPRYGKCFMARWGLRPMTNGPPADSRLAMLPRVGHTNSPLVPTLDLPAMDLLPLVR